MTGPSITVVVPVHNSERFVSEALSAILSQSYPPDEVIVVDDGSTDGTAAALAPFRRRIRFVRQSRRGHPAAYNTGFALARGDYVARCDADDVWEPDKLERQWAALREHPQIDIAAGAAWIFGREARMFAQPAGDGVLERRAFVDQLFRSNGLCASSTLIRRSLFERIGPFADRLACEDYEFWLRAARAGAVFYYDPTVVVRYRRHWGNVSNDHLAMARAVRSVHVRHAPIIDDSRLVQRVLAEDCARVGRLLVHNDCRLARTEYLGALRHRVALRELVWAAVLSLPMRFQRQLIDAGVRTRCLSATHRPEDLPAGT